jgi:hypothetical protein
MHFILLQFLIEFTNDFVKLSSSEGNNFTFTRFMIKKRNGTGNISGAVEPF